VSVPLELRAAAHRRQDASLDLGLDLHGRSPQVSDAIRVDECRRARSYGHWRGKLEIPAAILVLIFMGCSLRLRAGAAAVGREQPAADLGLDLHGDSPRITWLANARSAAAARAVADRDNSALDLGRDFHRSLLLV